jgi:hypothetical protein
MARMKKIATPEERKDVEEKLDFVFRIFLRTNKLRGSVVVRIELPNNEVHQKYYGNMPKYEVVIPYIGETFEYYLDNNLVGMRKLAEASPEHMKFEEVKCKRCQGHIECCLCETEEDIERMRMQQYDQDC